MIDPIGIFSTAGYGAAAWQAKIDAARTAQRDQALEEAGKQQNLRNNQATNNRAAEFSGSFAAQALSGRIADSRSTVEASDDALNGNQSQAKGLRTSSLFDGTELQNTTNQPSPFRLAELEARRPQTIADLQSPSITLDSSAFANLFANARPTLSLATNTKPVLNAESQPFQRATATLARVYGGNDELAIDFAA